MVHEFIDGPLVLWLLESKPLYKLVFHAYPACVITQLPRVTQNKALLCLALAVCTVIDEEESKVWTLQEKITTQSAIQKKGDNISQEGENKEIAQKTKTDEKTSSACCWCIRVQCSSDPAVSNKLEECLQLKKTKWNCRAATNLRAEYKRDELSWILDHHFTGLILVSCEANFPKATTLNVGLRFATLVKAASTSSSSSSSSSSSTAFRLSSSCGGTCNLVVIPKLLLFSRVLLLLLNGSSCNIFSSSTQNRCLDKTGIWAIDQRSSLSATTKGMQNFFGFSKPNFFEKKRIGCSSILQHIDNGLPPHTHIFHVTTNIKSS